MTTPEGELKALMVAALGGDEPAYRDVLRRLSGYLRGYYKTRLMQSGRSATEAEDLVQETLMALHARRHTYDPLQPFTPWLYAIARYKLIDFLRRTRAAAASIPLEDVEGLTADNDPAASESS